MEIELALYNFTIKLVIHYGTSNSLYLITSPFALYVHIMCIKFLYQVLICAITKVFHLEEKKMW